MRPVCGLPLKHIKLQQIKYTYLEKKQQNANKQNKKKVITLSTINKRTDLGQDKDTLKKFKLVRSFDELLLKLILRISDLDSFIAFKSEL